MKFYEYKTVYIGSLFPHKQPRRAGPIPEIVLDYIAVAMPL